MTYDDPHRNGAQSPAAPNPWPLLVTGVVSLTIGALALPLVARVDPAHATLIWVAMGTRFVLLALGALAVGGAIILRPRSARVLGVAAGAAIIASFAVNRDWDTIQMAFRVLAAVAGAAAMLVLLPQRIARAAVSVLVLFHFGGILIAVTSVPPPGGPPPWITTQLWTRIYRPYLQFMYLNNAYHFYSPDPGPATLLWARIEYQDGSHQWLDIPNRAEHMKDPLGLSYYRRLAMTESTNQLQPPAEVPASVLQRRMQAGAILNIPAPQLLVPQTGGAPQYRVPNDYSQRMLRNYARFLAHNHPHADLNVAVTGVKIYRTTHAIILPDRLLARLDPADPTLYLPYFQGEYDRDGKLKDASDPFLYWLLPIVRVEKKAAAPGGAATSEVIDYMRIHADATKGRG